MPGKIIVTAKIMCKSPLRIGSGENENTDADIILNSKNEPFIPATAFTGVLYREFLRYGHRDIADKFWSVKNEEQSKFICEDLTLEGSAKIMIRDNIAIDNKTGRTLAGAKFDGEVLEPGSFFNLHMEIQGVDEEAKAFALITKAVLSEKGIALGAKTANGFGKIFIDTINFCKLDFSKKEDIILWLRSDFSRKDKLDSKVNASLNKPAGELLISADFDIKTSLLIKNYYDPFIVDHDVDSVNLKSMNRNVISGTSLKGALRARAERIIYTLGVDPDIITKLFGDVEKDKKGKPKKKGNSIPGRLFVEETFIDNVSEELQNRIKIDRFSGGTIEGALFDSMPLFPKNNNGSSHICNMTIRVENAEDKDTGLLLLLLKDLWTGDIALGGEKNIGRGVLAGKKAKIEYKSESFEFNDPQNLKKEQIEKLDNYVKSLANYSIPKTEVKNV